MPLVALAAAADQPARDAAPQAPRPRRLSVPHEASPLQWPRRSTPGLSLTDLRGKVVLSISGRAGVPSVAPRCPCSSGSTASSRRRGLAVIGINAREDKRAVGRYATELGLTFPLVLDPDGKNNALYGVIGIPTTFVIGRDGRAVAFGVGAREWGGAPARALIEALLAEPLPPPDAR